MKARDFKIVSLCLLVALNLSYVARVVPGFAAGTLLAVMEEDGFSWIPIEQVESGDRLLSSDCDFEPITVRVTAVFEYIVESFLSEIHLTRDRYARRVMVTTPDQLFLKYNEYDRDEWIAAEYLNDGHYIEWKRDSILGPKGTPFPVTTNTGREADLPVFFIEVSAPYTFIVSDSSFSNRPLYMGKHPDRHIGVLAHNGIPENIAPYVPEFIECLCNLPYMPPLENNQTRIALKVVEDVATPVIQMVVDTAKMAETPVGKTILEAGTLGVSAAVVGAVAVAASNTFNNNNNPNMINLGELERTNQQQVYDLVRQSSSTLSSDARNAQSAGAAIYNYERSKHEQQILHEKYNNGGCEYDLPNYGFDVVIIDGRAYPQKSGVMKVRDRFCSYQEALALQAACEEEIQEEERTWGRDNYILGHHTPNKVKREREERKIQRRERDEAMRQYINDRMRSGDYDVEKIARDINNGNYKNSITVPNITNTYAEISSNIIETRGMDTGYTANIGITPIIQSTQYVEPKSINYKKSHSLAKKEIRSKTKNNNNSTIIETTATDGIEFIPVHEKDPADNIHSTPIIEHHPAYDILVHPIHEFDPLDNILSTPIPDPQLPDVCGIPILEQDNKDIYNTKRGSEPSEKKERKENTMSSQEFSKKYKDRYIKTGPDTWQSVDKKSGFLDGKAKYLQKDRLHNEYEAFSKGSGRKDRIHLGAIDPETGELCSDPVPGREMRGI